MGHAASSNLQESQRTQSDENSKKPISQSTKWLREVIDGRPAGNTTTESSFCSDMPLKYFDSAIISRSWLDILSSAEFGEDGTVLVHGMTLFQNCFFEKLRCVDKDDLIFKRLCKCQSNGTASHKSPGHLLMIIIRYISTNDSNCRTVRVKLFVLFCLQMKSDIILLF